MDVRPGKQKLIQCPKLQPTNYFSPARDHKKVRFPLKMFAQANYN